MDSKEVSIKHSTALTSISIEKLTEAFLSSQDVSETTRHNYSKSLVRFLTWLKDNDISEPTREDIIRYKEYLKSEGLRPGSVNTYLVGVRSFFSWAEGMKMYPNIASSIKGYKIRKSFKKDALSYEQVEELLDSIDNTTIKGLRDLALINLIIHTSLRRGAVVRLDIGDIRQEGEDRLLYYQGKGRVEKDEYKVITDKGIYDPIRNYLNERPYIKKENPLFVSHSNRDNGDRLTPRSISRIVKSRLRDIGINNPRLSCHSLRHTSITLDMKAGGSLEEAKLLAGHQSIDTTLIYLHHLDRIRNAPENRIARYLRDKRTNKNDNNRVNVSLHIEEDIGIVKRPKQTKEL